MSAKIPKSMLFRVCLYLSPDIEGVFVAHCLELDLIGEGNTPEEAIIELIQAIELQVETCESPSQLFFPAPGWVWKRYKESKRAGRVVLQRIIDHALQSLPQLHYKASFEDIVATSTVPQEYVNVASV